MIQADSQEPQLLHGTRHDVDVYSKVEKSATSPTVYGRAGDVGVAPGSLMSQEDLEKSPPAMEALLLRFIKKKKHYVKIWLTTDRELDHCWTAVGKEAGHKVPVVFLSWGKTSLHPC